MQLDSIIRGRSSPRPLGNGKQTILKRVVKRSYVFDIREPRVYRCVNVNHDQRLDLVMLGRGERLALVQAVSTPRTAPRRDLREKLQTARSTLMEGYRFFAGEFGVCPASYVAFAKEGDLFFNYEQLTEANSNRYELSDFLTEYQGTYFEGDADHIALCEDVKSDMRQIGVLDSQLFKEVNLMGSGKVDLVVNRGKIVTVIEAKVYHGKTEGVGLKRSLLVQLEEAYNFFQDYFKVRCEILGAFRIEGSRDIEYWNLHRIKGEIEMVELSHSLEILH